MKATIYEGNHDLTLIRLPSILGNMIYSVADPIVELTPLMIDSSLGNLKCHGIQNDGASIST